MSTSPVNKKAVATAAPAESHHDDTATKTSMLVKKKMEKGDSPKAGADTSKTSMTIGKKVDKVDSPKSGQKDVKTDGKKNEKTDPKPKEKTYNPKLFEGTVGLVARSAEEFFHIDHRLRKWNYMFSEPKVVNGRIQGESELNKKVAVFQKALPEMIKAIREQFYNLEKRGRHLQILLDDLEEDTPVDKETRVKKVAELKGRAQKIRKTDPLAYFERIQGILAKKLAEKEGNVSAAIKAKAISEALKYTATTVELASKGADLFPLFTKDGKSSQEKFKKHFVAFVEQICGPIYKAFTADYRHLIKAVLVDHLMRVAQKIEAMNEENVAPEVILKVFEEEVAACLTTLSKIAFGGKANDVSKALEGVYKPLVDMEQIHTKVARGEEVTASEIAKATVPDKYWTQFAGNKDFPQIDAHIAAVKEMYTEYLLSADKILTMMQLRNQVGALVEKVKAGSAVDMKAFRPLIEQATRLTEGLAKSAKSTTLYRMAHTLEKEISFISTLAQMIPMYKKAVDNVKSADSENARSELGLADLDQLFEEFGKAAEGEEYLSKGCFLPALKEYYKALKKEVPAKKETTASK